MYPVYMGINTTLQKLGLNEKEVAIYTALMKNGKATPSTLAKLTKINRATVYNIAKSLQSLGIIAEDLGGKTLYFAPLPAKSLEQIIQRPIRELREKESLIKQAMDELSLITARKEYPTPKIRFVEENDLRNFLYENMEKWQTSVRACDKVWWGTQDYTFLEEYGEFVDWYWEQPFAKDVNMYQIGNESKAEKEMQQKHAGALRDVRFSTDVDFTSSVWVGGEYLIMIVTKQHPFYLFEIHDATLAHNMRQVFKKMWHESSVKTDK